ncbi:MAG: class I SAM-dependent methyltransferase [Angustibacter sp.]
MRSVRSSGGAPSGSITRGTTNPNRLRRVDRWLCGPMRGRWATTAYPLAVDLGYGHTPITTVELFHRLRTVHPRVELIGLEIDPARVLSALPLERGGLSFVHGGFEVPLAGREADVIRAFNVLRQYPAAEVPGIWRQLTARLAPSGICIDGTCDESGRLASWVTLTTAGPQSITFSWRLRGLSTPSVIAARLPKALIHLNIPGEPIHELLSAMDAAWQRNARLASVGVRQRFIAMAEELHRSGWPLDRAPSRWRLGELTVDWRAVSAAGPGAP